MKFAFLGISPDAAPLLRHVVACADHHLVAVYSDHPAPQQGAPQQLPLRPEGQWEELLLADAADGVILAPEPHRSLEDPVYQEALRKLTQAQVPLLVVHPACESIVGYELDMIRQDTGSLLTAWAPGWESAEVRELVAWIETHRSEGPLQLDCRRHVAADASGNQWKWLARDAALVGLLLGEIKRVSALGDAQRLTNVSVTLTTPRDEVARWSTSVQPPADRLIVEATCGNAMRRVELSLADSESLQHEAAEALAALARQARGSADPGPDSGPDRWLIACRGSEVAETAQRSAERGKTYELHTERVTEEDTFKGMMAAGGCGILLLAFLVVVVFSMVEGVRYPYQRRDYDQQRQAAEPAAEEALPPATRWPLWLRMWPVYPLGLFLVLQLLRLVYRGRPATGPRGGSPDEPRDAPVRAPK